MEIQASRAKARTGPNGEPILLLEQNRGRWDQLLIRPWPDCSGACRSAGRRERTVRFAGGDCRLSRASQPSGSDRLDPHRDAVRGLGRAHALAGRRAEPRGSGVDGPRSRRRPFDHRSATRASHRCARTTCCPACVATCCTSLVDWTKRARSSSAQRRSRAMRVSGRCWSERAEACARPRRRLFHENELPAS